ncbi:MAG: type II secretion system protein [Planctomycetota bacterium]
MCWDYQARRSRISGFSLIELIVVVMLLGLAASIALISVRRPLLQSTFQRTLSAMQAADFAEREQARLIDRPGAWIWEPTDQTMRFLLTGRNIRLPAGLQLVDVDVWKRNQWINSPIVPIGVSGQSPTIRMRWRVGAETTDDESNVGPVSCVIGMTGRWIQ